MAGCGCRYAGLCNDPVVGAQITLDCPVLCDRCTSSTTTATITSSVTTTTMSLIELELARSIIAANFAPLDADADGGCTMAASRHGLRP